MASQLAAVANANVNGNGSNPGLNLSTNSNGSVNQSSDLPNNNNGGQVNEMQLAQQRFMMMMFLYNQFLQAQTQSS
jgi:hypothetical protein